MKIRDFILSLVSWFILLVTVSCSDELGGERAPISSESNLHVLVPTVLSSRGTRTDDASGLPTYNATVDECQINDLTLYAFPVKNEGKLLVETLPAPLATMMVEQHVANYQLTIEPGTYHIYVVANMNKVLSGQPKPIQTEDDLKKIVLGYGVGTEPGMPVSTNIPMIYEPKDVNGTIINTKIEKSGKKYTEVAANLKFTCVKVKLNLIMDPTASDNLYGKSYSITDIVAQKLTPSTHLLWDGKFTQKESDVTSVYATGIKNTIYPSLSTGEASTGRYYQNGEYTIDENNANENNKDVVSITDRTNKGKDAPTNLKQWLFQGTYYLPERYISKADEQSVLKINGIVNNSNKNQYTINLGHKQNASDLPTFPRGTYYEITGKIKSLGNMTLNCNVSVEDWTPVTIDADFNHTRLWVSKTKASVTSTTTDSIDYDSNVILTEADFGCDEKVGEKDVIVTKLDAVNHRITFNINKDILFSEYKGKYRGTAKVWIKAGNIKKYLDVAYDASPYFEVNPQEVTIYWKSDNSTKLVQFKTNLGGLVFTKDVTSSTVGKSTIEASCDNSDTPEGTFKIVATSDPITMTVHYLTVQPKESAEGFNFVKQIKVTVKPAVGNYRINFRAINDRAHYTGGESNGTDNYKGTPEEKKEETYNGNIGNTNWADGWLDLSDDNDKRIYIPQTDSHRIYVYTQIGETTGAVASSKVWKFSDNWPGNQMVADKTNVGWYYNDFPKDAQSKSTDSGATGTRTIKPGETLIMFSNNTNTNWGFTLHRCPHHLEPGIPLFDYEDKEGWIVYDPTSDPTWNIYDDMPTIENINFTIYTKFQTHGWFNVYGAANGKNNDNNNTERESFTIYDTAGKSWSCENLNNGWYKTVITLKAVKGDHEKAIRIKKDNGESVLLFNGNSYEKYHDTGFYDGTSWRAGKPF
jgi:hypothetical protein